MRYILALFDAPVPAARALDALAEAGFTPAEVAVVPQPPGTRWPGGGSFTHLPGEDPHRLAQTLSNMGVPAEEAQTYAEGVARGGILVAIRTPTLSVPIALSILHSVGSPDLTAHRARWAADSTWRYDWTRHPPPTVDPPAVTAGPPASKVPVDDSTAADSTPSENEPGRPEG